MMNIMRFKRQRREDIGRCEDGLAAQGADTGSVQNGVGLLGLRFVAGAFRVLLSKSSGGGIRRVKARDGAVETLSIFGGKLFEKRAVRLEPFEKIGGMAHACEEGGFAVLGAAGHGAIYYCAVRRNTDRDELVGADVHGGLLAGRFALHLAYNPNFIAVAGNCFFADSAGNLPRAS